MHFLLFQFASLQTFVVITSWTRLSGPPVFVFHPGVVDMANASGMTLPPQYQHFTTAAAFALQVRFMFQATFMHPFIIVEHN